MKTYSKIVCFGSPNNRQLTIKAPKIASSKAGMEKQTKLADEMVGTGSCTYARVICSESLADLKAASMSDWDKTCR